jgi:membrane protein implicated in regulation of membrane protease activity
MYETLVSPVFVWAIVGIILFIVELMTLTFVFAFFGVGALIVSLTTWVGITPGLNAQLAVFSVSSLFMTFVLRKTAKKLFFGSHDAPPDYKGQKVKVARAIPVSGEGTISYRGSEWIAFSDSAEMISEGSTVEIVSLDGIRAKVKYIEQTT